MLTIKVDGREFFNENTCEFIKVEPIALNLEHSLISISKWESKWHKPFLQDNNKTVEEINDYIRCMTMNPKVDPMVYSCISAKDVQRAQEYINEPMTATTFSDIQKNKFSKEIITSELIYYWMISYNIPSDYEKWHLNRLLTLIHICGIKNQDPKKMPQNEILRSNAALNAARRKAMNSKG